MLPRLAAALLLATGFHGCIVYEYEHEFWLRVDGSGSVDVTGRPVLWTAFKALGRPEDPEGTATPEAARRLFESAGLRVRRVDVTHRRGRAYMFVSADFEDVNRLSGSAAFPDLHISLRKEADRLRLRGEWARPPGSPDIANHREGLMAVRFHLPSKVYEHRNAADGVERGNIVAWRQEVAQGLDGRPLAFGAVMDERSILLSTVVLFGAAILLALALLGGALYAVARRGRKDLATSGS
jgi:hypothetical protein